MRRNLVRERFLGATLTVPPIPLARVVTGRLPRSVLRVLIRPAARQLRLHFVELALAEVRILGGDVTEQIGAASVLERAIGRASGMFFEVRAIVPHVVLAQLLGSLGHSPAGPPPAQRAR